MDVVGRWVGSSRVLARDVATGTAHELELPPELTIHYEPGAEVVVCFGDEDEIVGCWLPMLDCGVCRCSGAKD